MAGGFDSCLVQFLWHARREKLGKQMDRERGKREWWVMVDETVLIVLALEKKYFSHQVHIINLWCSVYFLLSYWLYTSLLLLLLVVSYVSRNTFGQIPENRALCIVYVQEDRAGKKAIVSAVSLLSQEKVSVEWKPYCGVLSRARLFKLLKSCWRGEVHAFCSVEAAIGGEIGISAPSEMDFFLGECSCKMV